MANESRVLDIFGPNFLIESNGESVGIGGFAYQIYATTKTPAGGNTIKYQQVLKITNNHSHSGFVLCNFVWWAV